MHTHLTASRKSSDPIASRKGGSCIEILTGKKLKDQCFCHHQSEKSKIKFDPSVASCQAGIVVQKSSLSTGKSSPDLQQQQITDANMPIIKEVKELNRDQTQTSTSACKISEFKSKNEWLSKIVENSTIKIQYTAEKNRSEIMACRDEINSASFLKCTQPILNTLHRTLQTLGRLNHDAQFGLSIPDDEYLKKATPYIGLESLPGSVRSQTFLGSLQNTSMDDPTSFHAVEKEIESINAHLSTKQQWKFIAFHQSGIAPGFDDHFPASFGGRGLLYIPAEYFKSLKTLPKPTIRDLFLQYSIRPLKSSLAAQQFSALAVTTTPKQGKEFFIRDYWRTLHPENSLRTRVTGGPDTTERCTACHTSGPIALHPESYQPQSDGVVFAYPEKNHTDMLSFFNKTITQLSSSTNAVQGDITLGDNKEDDEPFLECAESSAQSLSPESIQKVKKASHCINCHKTGGLRNPLYLNPFTSSTMVRTYIINHDMPPGSKLNDDELEVLNKCLYQAAFMQFKKKMTEIPCDTDD